MTRRARIFSWIAVGVILLFLFAPVVLVVLFSFNSGEGTSPPFEGFSTRWYAAVFDSAEYSQALTHTAIVAVVTVIVTTVVGVLAAVGLARAPRRVNIPVSAALAAPIITPLLFTGLALLVFFDRVSVDLGLQTVIVGHVLITLPLVVFIIGARMSRLDPAAVAAARDLGATAWQSFFRIVLPQLLPAILGAALLVAATSVDELIIALFLNGGEATVPVVIFTAFHSGLDPKINAVASMLVALTVLLTIVAGRFVSAREVAR